MLVEEPAVGDERRAQQAVARHRRLLLRELLAALAPAALLGLQTGQQPAAALQLLRHLADLRRDLLHLLRLHAVVAAAPLDLLVQRAQPLHARAVLLPQRLALLREALHRVVQRLHALNVVRVLQLRLAPHVQRAARARGPVHRLEREVRVVQNLLRLLRAPLRDALRLEVHDAADEVLLAQHLLDLLPGARLLAQQAAHRLDRQLHVVRRLDHRADLVQLRLVDLRHAVLRLLQRRLHLVQLRAHLRLLRLDLAVLLRQLLRQPRRRLLVLRRQLLLLHDLP